MQQLTLTHGKWLVELMPQIGGSISRCAYDGQDMLRPAVPVAEGFAEARDMSSFPLVPFSNRIEHGRFEFNGESVHLPRNMGDHPHALHGQGWRRVWAVESEAPGQAVLAYDHEADTWPWRYVARQFFELSDDAMTLRLAVINMSDRPMPVGLGLHPYFLKTEGVSLTTGVTHQWESTNEQIPTQLVPLPQELDFSRGLKIEGLDLDHCFTGWSRVATIDWPGRPYRLLMEGSPTLEYLVVYTPPGRDFFCVEGVDNMINAFNWMSRGIRTGVTILLPGQTHEIVTVFRAQALAS